MTGAADRITNLSPQELALFLARIKRKPQEAPVIKRHRELQRFPLSYAQQRIWFLQRLEPNTPLFNSPSAWLLEGPLNVPALQASLEEVHRRHESLRTSFPVHDGAPVQLVGPTRSVALPVLDLSDLSKRTRREEANRIAIDWTSTMFDLERGPLTRACLLKLDEERHILSITMHHIITDGWSFQVLFRELSTLYDATLEKRESPLPELEVQYGDYALWQRERRQQSVEQQIAYWKNQLADAPAILKLPTDRPRRAGRSQRGAAQLIIFSNETTSQIRALTQREGVTLFMTMVAAFQTLLCRYSGQEDICVGTPLAGRTPQQTERLIGFFINTLVLRTDLRGNPTFRELLGRVRDTYLTGHANQEAPFEELVAELKPDRSLGQTPFFQVWFAMQNMRQTPPKFAGLTVSPVGVNTGASHFDLALMLREGPENIGASLIFSTELFEPSTAGQILRDYEALLQQVSAQPEQRILEIDFQQTDDKAADIVAEEFVF